MASRTLMRPGKTARTLTPFLLICLTVAALLSLAGGAATPATSAAAPAAPAAPNSQYGFVMALLDNNSDVKDMGFNWVQYGVYWMDAEPNPDEYSWGHVDNIVNRAREARLNVLIRVSRPPEWARDPNCATVDTCPPQDASDFGDFAYELAAHVRPMIAPYRVAYEIWNEPNTDIEWGNMCPQPARYAALLQAAYNPIKTADPQATVVAGAVTTVGERVLRGSNCYMDDITFLEQMYASGAAPNFDALSDHPYGFASTPETDPATSSNRLNFRRAERHREIMVQYGDEAKQIWATEMGWALDPQLAGVNCNRPDWFYVYSPEQQADYLVRAFRWARSYWPWMGPMFVFNYDFSEASWYETCHAFRFWSVTGRPAQGALASFVQNPPPTYTPIATPSQTATSTPYVDAPPSIQAVRYNRTAFGEAGGTLIIEVDAGDNDATPIDTVHTLLQYPDGGTQLFTLDLVAGTNQQGTWRVSITIAANNTNENQVYIVSPYVVESFPPRRVVNAPSQQITVSSTRFSDVPEDFWAYSFIEYLASGGVIGGYDDGSFRPNNPTTRAQLTKIVVLGFNLPQVTPGNAQFADVPVGSTFYTYVATAYGSGLITGYPCGGQGEPCDAQNRPYFRPNANVTRAQIAKIVVLAAEWSLVNPPNAAFQDVPTDSTFYQHVETAFAHNILGGYECGGQGEPCDAQRRPYFRPGNNATRAQISKMVYLAVTEAAPTPTATSTPLPSTTETSTATPGVKKPPFPTATVTPGVKPATTAAPGKR
ncbi:MAG TPA: S-layer homology domain-containing protein [Chloroflexia bacterium]|nr:S-layer homology domain-containing protein [Chloroflexia bacterium]